MWFYMSDYFVVVVHFRTLNHTLPIQRGRVMNLPYEDKLCTKCSSADIGDVIVQELCESRGGRPALSVLTSLLVSVDVKIY